MQKSERLLNLLILLLVQRRYVGKARIRALIDDYRDAPDEAFERMFERDKGELRALGVPVETGYVDGFFEDEPGYRIPADEFALPGIELTADEAAVLGLATRVWRHAGLAGHTSDALAKLAAAGIDVDRGRLDVLAPEISAEEPAFDALWQASLDRQRVSFDYQRAGATAAMKRTLEPWGLVSTSGRWYVVGRDLDRDAERMFRLSRIQGRITKIGRAGSYAVPPGVDLRSLTRRLGPGPRTEAATLLVRQGSGASLRRTGDVVEAGVTGPDGSTGWDRVTLTVSSLRWLADEVLAHGTAVRAEAPDALVTEVVRRLDAVQESA
ncbi:helix-turn-helix transcriptional regulator [Nocardioides jiangxiensis]|uniref:WYL domain-containing protein n=1 Tax=Nocardioides jiangxiensis TaxID=3064524 RepID=A0ABT9B114_9ACTN|nr:WYL domain-containing protein [Nocardioides sp. WY-20]MDO7866838.1 WYL domain-containing protein [Nocardioides sp. WY-20]